MTNCSNHNCISSLWVKGNKKTILANVSNWSCRYFPHKPLMSPTATVILLRAPAGGNISAAANGCIQGFSGTFTGRVLYLILNIVSLVTESTVNSYTSCYKAGMWLFSERLIVVKGIKLKMSKREIRANFLADVFAWRASATNRRKKNKETGWLTCVTLHL